MCVRGQPVTAQQLFNEVKLFQMFCVNLRLSLEMVKRTLPGYAIGGLSGGEDKDEFWRVISRCTDLLPRDKPRYAMGVGSVPWYP